MKHKQHSAQTWAYLAGLIDARGSIMAADKRVRLVVSVDGSKLIRDFGGSTMKDGRWLMIKSADLVYVLENVLPFLRYKRAQAVIALRFLRVAMVERDSSNPSRAALYEAVQAMNQS